MAAMAGASGVRAWLQQRRWSWLTPRRLKHATVGLFVVATLVSTVGLSGSSKPAAPVSPAPQAAHVQPSP
jgi:hypothetical protein